MERNTLIKKKSKQNVFSNGRLTKRTLWLFQNESMAEKTIVKEHTGNCH